MASTSGSTSGSHTLYDSRSLATTLPAASSSIPVPPLFQTISHDSDHRHVVFADKTTVPSPPFSKWFHHRGDPDIDQARKVYFKAYFSGLLMVIITIYAVFSIYWGSLWKVPDRPIKGWIVDFDGGDVGQSVVAALSKGPQRFIKWDVVPADKFPTGVTDIIESVKQDKVWVALVVNQDVSSRLQSAILNPMPSYNGTQAITVYAAEARNENAYRNFIRPVVQTSLDAFRIQFATNLATEVSTSNNLVLLLSTAPQTVVNPVSFTLENILPFDQPVASAVIFVGLIYLLILSFFIVMICHGAREASGVDKLLDVRSLITVRLLSSLVGYFFLSLFYSLFNLAFKLNLTRRYGRGGSFWMINWVGMLSVGLALESLITILTPKFVPFFMILWIIVNVSVCVFPIDILPRIYHYGYAMPFYNISNSVRSIAFGTRNTIAMNFGVLFAWVLISCISLPIAQWYVRRRQVKTFEKRGSLRHPGKVIS